MFEEKEREHPGRIWGFPPESIYQGVDEEVRAELERVGPVRPTAGSSLPRLNGLGHTHGHGHGRANGVDSRTGSKGKARAGDEMDLG